MYDLFFDYNDGTPQLAALAWTNDTTRATSLTTEDGVYVKTGDTQQRYLGSFRTTGVSGQTEDSVTKRYLWNYYHRVRRPLLRQETTASWAYTTATIRQANAAAANQVEVVIGVQEAEIDLSLSAIAVNDTGGTAFGVGIGEDSTSTYASECVGGQLVNANASVYFPMTATLTKRPAIGRHFYSWNEFSSATGATTWRGTPSVAGAGSANGISGWCEG
jgi:hypothetical protein